MNAQCNTGGSYQHGFTLIELLFVLLILGLLTALIPPLFSGAVPGAKLKGAARDLAATLHYARSQAITRNAVMEVNLNTEAMQYQVGSDRTHMLPAGIRMDITQAAQTNGTEPSLEPSQQVVKFFPDGSASETLITLEGDNRGYQLDVNWLSGRVTMDDMEHNAQ